MSDDIEWLRCHWPEDEWQHIPGFLGWMDRLESGEWESDDISEARRAMRNGNAVFKDGTKITESSPWPAVRGVIANKADYRQRKMAGLAR